MSKVRREHGWRFYRVEDGEVGINRLRKPKFFPNDCRLNSSWLSRDEAMALIQTAKT